MNISENINHLQDRIDSAIKRGGHGRPVQLIAVTKTHPFSTIETCYKSGLRQIGENRIQEASSKFGSFKHMPGLTKRFIGHLQSNKVNKCLDLFDNIDSVDSFSLANKISNRCQTLGRKIPVLLEVNTSQEPQKHGFHPDNQAEMLACIGLENLKVNGLMTIGPLSKDEKTIRAAFSTLRNIKEKINAEIGQEKLSELSMGMSGDFEIGVEEGSTMVRVGTALLGPRKTI